MPPQNRFQQSDPDDDPNTVAEADLWFLPGPDLEEEDVPPGSLSANASGQGVLFDPAPWHRAQDSLSGELAEVAVLFGELDQRLRSAPQGWRQRLALREASDLSWWTGDRLGVDQIGLWVALRIGSTENTELAFARAGWAARHLSSGMFPAADLAAFLERTPRSMTAFDKDSVPDMAVADMADIMAAGKGLHPVVAAARLFYAWRALAPIGPAETEAAVLAARHAASMSRAPGQGALFLPLVQSGPDALRGQGDPESKLAAWLRGSERATLAALLHLDQVAVWRDRARKEVADLSGRTVPRLLDLLEGWLQITAPMAEAKIGASRAAVQRNLDILERRGVIREVTAQERYRVWTTCL